MAKKEQQPCWPCSQTGRDKRSGGTCSNCGGKGYIIVTLSRCYKCNGSGTMNIRHPGGVSGRPCDSCNGKGWT